MIIYGAYFFAPKAHIYNKDKVSVRYFRPA